MKKQLSEEVAPAFTPWLLGAQSYGYALQQIVKGSILLQFLQSVEVSLSEQQQLNQMCWRMTAYKTGQVDVQESGSPLQHSPPHSLE